jgi:hypothetical protein
MSPAASLVGALASPDAAGATLDALLDSSARGAEAARAGMLVGTADPGELDRGSPEQPAALARTNETSACAHLAPSLTAFARDAIELLSVAMRRG